MIGRKELYCHSCRRQLELAKKPGRADECTHCGAELHACLNCEYYDPRLTRGCRETQAEEVRDLACANFCNWFSFRVGRPEGDPASEAAAAKARAEALFGGKPTRTDVDSDREKARSAFDALFKR